MASKLYGVDATIIIFVFVLYCIVLYCIVLYCIVSDKEEDKELMQNEWIIVGGWID